MRLSMDPSKTFFFLMRMRWWWWWWMTMVMVKMMMLMTRADEENDVHVKGATRPLLRCSRLDVRHTPATQTAPAPGLLKRGIFHTVLLFFLLSLNLSLSLSLCVRSRLALLLFLTFHPFSPPALRFLFYHHFWLTTNSSTTSATTNPSFVKKTDNDSTALLLSLFYPRFSFVFHLSFIGSATKHRAPSSYRF